MICGTAGTPDGAEIRTGMNSTNYGSDTTVIYIEMQPSPNQNASASIHPFDSAAGEAFFKALLWVVVILQAILLGREYNRLNHPAHRAATAAAVRHHRR